MNIGTTHRHVHILPPNLPLRQTDGEEVPPHIEVGIDPQQTLTQGNKRRHVLNTVGGKMLQLHLVIIQQPLKKSMRGYGKPPLMKDGKGHDVPFGRCKLALIIGQQPLLDGGLRAEKAATDKALSPVLVRNTDTKLRKVIKGMDYPFI